MSGAVCQTLSIDTATSGLRGWKKTPLADSHHTIHQRRAKTLECLNHGILPLTKTEEKRGKDSHALRWAGSSFTECVRACVT